MHRRESCRICKHRSIGKSVAEKERPILLNAKYTINEERAKSSLLILTHHIQKPLNHLIFRVIGQNVLMANPSHQTFYPHYVSRSKQLHHPRLKDSFPIDSSHSFADK